MGFLWSVGSLPSFHPIKATATKQGYSGKTTTFVRAAGPSNPALVLSLIPIVALAFIAVVTANLSFLVCQMR